ncbi:hypothetical protein [Gloeobacter kilaueensis]|uniref:Uncharacterized protein n=1 Tax=Gloeobacter kilaueensis (strain ATCC BAA-2537 / CCAP 1431/1 / ULC 316 / JS1) TaxID=1183438 RepID=U5QNC4_GLOK1|nr:hypothetical protein [Gloeobacter kilaueensis]AGY59180.1 hypothetical protein GKIL_2934 [Gloeobacter kilaueensis JS1]
MVSGHTTLDGIVLRTLHVLRPGAARFGWVHAHCESAGFTSEAALRHHNYWNLPWTPREGPQFFGVGTERLASYPTILYGCERYLLRLESLCPMAFSAQTIEQFVAGLADWHQTGCDLARLVELFYASWPPR